MIKALTISLVLISATPLLAAEDLKQQKVAEFIRTIKLQDIFDQQIVQTRASYVAFGKKIFAEFQDQIGPSDDPAQKARLEAVFQAYLDRAMALWKPEDLAAIWSERFSQDLSEDDLDQLLAFYRTPLGPKIVAASQAANAALTEMVNTQSQNRLREAVEQLVTDLKAAAAK